MNPAAGQISLPVWGLSSGYNNSVEVTFVFVDGSSQKQSVSVVTPPFSDGCAFDTPTLLQSRTKNTDLSYDYLLVASSCSPNSHTIIDTNGAIRWVGTAGVASSTVTFYDNAV